MSISILCCYRADTTHEQVTNIGLWQQVRKRTCGVFGSQFSVTLDQQLLGGRGLKFSEASQPHCMVYLEEPLPFKVE